MKCLIAILFFETFVLCAAKRHIAFSITFIKKNIFCERKVDLFLKVPWAFMNTLDF